MNAIDYPTISVGKHKDIVVRQTIAAEILIGRRGLSMATLGIDIHPWKVDREGKNTAEPNPNSVANLITVFSCFVAENFIDQDNPARVSLDTVPTADYWACQIDDIGEVTRVVHAAIKKALEARRAKLAAVPPVEQAS